MGRLAKITQPKAARSPANDSQVAERLDALRRMSGALTHDFNNLLGVIVSANERLAAELPEGGEAQRLALLALEAAERGAELLQRALSATHDRQDDAAEAVEASATLSTVERLTRQAISSDIELTVYAAEPGLACRAERTDLEMALLNLCLNAGQATPDGGRIVVRAKAVRVGATSARLGLTSGAYVAFTVRDTGSGMTPDVLARAMDPLFTTKATGTGLGLSSVLDFANGAGGALALSSRPGHGTTATLYVPAA